MSQIEKKKLKLGFLNPISGEWVKFFTSTSTSICDNNQIEQVSRVDDADYIIYESNGDPVHVIMKIKATFPKNKLVFILSGDQSQHIDNDCIWFTNAVLSSGLARRQIQVFVTNPAIFKYYDKNIKDRGVIEFKKRYIDVYFKGTIWSGMREDMYNHFTKSNQMSIKCYIQKNNDYWSWRLNNQNKPTHAEIEQEAYKTYEIMEGALLCLCPKGNGNSSMRIVEAIACGAVPVLINDFSAPFGNSWEESGVALAFDTKVHTWDHIYDECCKLIGDKERLEKMQKKGQEYFKDFIYGDARLPKFKMYENLDTVAFGFSNLILDKLRQMSN